MTKQWQIEENLDGEWEYYTSCIDEEDFQRELKAIKRNPSRGPFRVFIIETKCETIYL